MRHGNFENETSVRTDVDILPQPHVIVVSLYSIESVSSKQVQIRGVESWPCNSTAPFVLRFDPSHKKISTRPTCRANLCRQTALATLDSEIYDLNR